jgi:DNA-binding HxlR family transcriptional regulator
VAPKVLTQTLRAMERDGLLTRTVFAQVPPRVDYALTELGSSLAAPLAVLTDWAETHVGEIVASRERFETAATG